MPDTAEDESACKPRGKSATVDSNTSDKKLSAWAQLFKNNRDMSAGLKLEQCDRVEVVQLNHDDVQDSRVIWKGSLIGYVVGKRTEHRDIEELRKAWNLSFQYVAHPSGWTIFKFDDEKQKQAVLTNGPYKSSGFPWILKDIPPFFSFGDESFSFIPVWITLPGLPIECWCTKALSKITSQVGKPIATDRCTAYQARVSFARVLVEIDARKALVREMPIKMPNGELHNQPVLYEYEPRLCTTCNRVGHTADYCKSVKKSRGTAKLGVVANNQKPSTSCATMVTENAKKGTSVLAPAQPAGATVSKAAEGTSASMAKTGTSVKLHVDQQAQKVVYTKPAEPISTKATSSGVDNSLVNLTKASIAEVKSTKARSAEVDISLVNSTNAPFTEVKSTKLSGGTIQRKDKEPVGTSDAKNSQQQGQVEATLAKTLASTEMSRHNQFQTLSVVDTILEEAVLLGPPESRTVEATRDNIASSKANEPSTSNKGRRKQNKKNH